MKTVPWPPVGSSGLPLGLSWAPFGFSWALLGPSVGFGWSPGAVLGAFWELFGAYGVSLGPSRSIVITEVFKQFHFLGPSWRIFGFFFSFSASQGVFWVILGVPLGTLGAHLVLLWGLWGLLWEVFGISFRGLLAPLGQSGSLGGSWGRFLVDV